MAAPIKIPNLSACVQGNGSIVIKQKCGKSEARLDLSAISNVAVNSVGQGPKGDKGDQGPQGANGTFSLTKCINREQSASGVSVLSVSSPCLVSEFVVTSGCSVTSGVGVVYRQRLVVADNTILPTKPYGIVSCGAYDAFNTGEAFTLTAQALCCQP